MDKQRCIECLCDLPGGSPPRCKACLKSWDDFGGIGYPMHFVGNHVPAKGVDDDPDAWGRSDQDHGGAE